MAGQSGCCGSAGKVTQAWRDFVESLATLLPTLPSGARLDLTLDPTASGTGDASYSVSAWSPKRVSCGRWR